MLSSPHNNIKIFAFEQVVELLQLYDAALALYPHRSFPGHVQTWAIMQKPRRQRHRDAPTGLESCSLVASAPGRSTHELSLLTFHINDLRDNGTNIVGVLECIQTASSLMSPPCGSERIPQTTSRNLLQSALVSAGAQTPLSKLYLSCLMRSGISSSMSGTIRRESILTTVACMSCSKHRQRTSPMRSLLCSTMTS